MDRAVWRPYASCSVWVLARAAREFATPSIRALIISPAAPLTKSWLTTAFVDDIPKESGNPFPFTEQ